MNPEEDIFEGAAALPTEERQAYLQTACAGQPELRARVEALLRSHDVRGFMESPAGGPPVSPVEERCEQIGRYQLLRKIGEGGFGVVWLAEQIEPVTRRVALKIIKAGMDTEEVIARFEAERQALAMMDDPHIARVFDAGATDKGRPYFVMELVEGIPITQFCDEQHFNIRQRLELFADVCSAITHAHQKGIIHRDIKPSNVMVSVHAGKPVVKVIDFGIAKAIQGKLTDRTLLTRLEHFVGTPAHMSPEQTALSGMDVDTRSDIYSLGILLYELLAGKPPFDSKTLLASGYEGMRRIIREVEPPKPSTRLNSADAEDRTTLAMARQIAPEKLSSIVEPDLDWIVMKAIEKDRDRRYASANDLTRDIQRFLRNEPVSASPPTASYRLRKFVHRNRLALRVAGAIAMVLVAATVVSISMAVKAIQAEKRAGQRAASERRARIEADGAKLNAEALAGFFTDALRRADPERGGRNMTVIEAVHEAIRELDLQLSNLSGKVSDHQAYLMWTLHSLGFTHQIIPLQEKVRDYYVATYGPDHERSLLSSINLACYIISDRPADRILGKATTILEELVSREDVWPEERNKEWLETLALLGECYKESNRLEEAIQLQEKSLQNCRTHYADDSVVTLRVMYTLSASLLNAGRMEDGIALREETWAIHSKISGPEDPKTLKCRHMLANAYFTAGRYHDALKLRDETAQLYRKVLGTKDPNTLIAIHNFAESCFEAGRKEEATRLLEEVLPLQPAASGPKHPDTLEAMHDLATCYYDAGRCEEALKLREAVLALRKEVLEQKHPDTLER